MTRDRATQLALAVATAPTGWIMALTWVAATPLILGWVVAFYTWQTIRWTLQRRWVR